MSTIGNCVMSVLCIAWVYWYRHGEKSKPDTPFVTGVVAAWMIMCAVFRAWIIWSMPSYWSDWLALIALTWAAAALANMAWRKRLMPR